MMNIIREKQRSRHENPNENIVKGEHRKWCLKDTH